jgi:hypothetical protein
MIQEAGTSVVSEQKTIPGIEESWIEIVGGAVRPAARATALGRAWYLRRQSKWRCAFQ